MSECIISRVCSDSMILPLESHQLGGRLAVFDQGQNPQKELIGSFQDYSMATSGLSCT